MNPDGLDLAGPDRLISLVGDVVTVLSPKPLPVGRRVDLSLGPDAGPPVGGKVIDAVSSSDAFRIRIRLHSLPPPRRLALAALLPRP